VRTGTNQQGHEQAITDGSTPQLIAHRGFAGIFPENTVAALANAAADGRTDAVELDVVPTRDGQIVVFHDDTLARVTNAPESIRKTNLWELSYEQIAGYSVLGTGESIPLLSDVLDAIPPGVRVNIELKNPGCDDLPFAETLDEQALATATDRWQDFIGRILDTTADYDNELLLSSFYEGALAATREQSPAVPIASVFYDSIETGLELTERYDTEAVHLPWNMVSGTPFFNEPSPAPAPFADVDLVGIAHDAGRQVNAWTVKTWREAIGLHHAGVDGIIADYPGVFSNLSIQETAIEAPAEADSSGPTAPAEPSGSSGPSEPTSQ